MSMRLDILPWEEILDLADVLLEKGVSEEEAVNQIAEILDQIIDCETMINSDGSPNTAHTTNPVPVILVDSEKKKIKEGILGDIAPTILDLLDIDVPDKMTQKSLILK